MQNPTDHQSKPDYTIIVAWVFLMAVGGPVVSAIHNLEWSASLACFAAGIILGSFGAALLGMRLWPSWGILGMVIGLYEGVIQGWMAFGPIGAVAGGLLGIIYGLAIAVLSTAIRCLIMSLCGIDPYCNIDANDNHRSYE